MEQSELGGDYIFLAVIVEIACEKSIASYFYHALTLATPRGIRATLTPKGGGAKKALFFFDPQ